MERSVGAGRRWSGVAGVRLGPPAPALHLPAPSGSHYQAAEPHPGSAGAEAVATPALAR